MPATKQPHGNKTMAEKLAGILESYRGRDRIVRITGYTCMLAGGLLKDTTYSKLAEKLTVFSGHMSECRTVLRLFDDLAMFVHVRRYGIGLQEKDLFIRMTNLIDNFFGQVFYPLEHIAWAQDQKLLPGSSSRLWVLSILCWLGSLCASVVQNMWLLVKLHQEEQQWRKQQRELWQETEDTSSLTQPPVDRQLEQARYSHARHLWFRSQQLHLIANIITSVADLGNAVHWSIPGFLWAGKLQQSLVGLLGTVASAGMLYTYLYPVKPWQQE